MRLPELRIRNLQPKIPIIQGGMAVRISTSELAAAVANEGGIGVIAGSGMTVDELRNEIRRAKSLTNGIIGVNIMFAVNAFAELVKTAISEKIDLVISGAGFSRDMFSLGKESNTPIIPIVSTAKLAKISEKLGAAAVVVEGSEAGGHLGTDRSMKEIVPEVKKAVKIPVIAAGGIVDGKDAAKAFSLGADGIQIGMRFAASKESNAADNLKEFYVKAKEEDIVLINSPVGLPGRAIKNKFLDKIQAGIKPKIEKCSNCLKTCNIEKTPYCISQALINSVKGNVDDGLVFAGSNVYKIDKMQTVKQIFNELVTESEKFYKTKVK